MSSDEIEVPDVGEEICIQDTDMESVEEDVGNNDISEKEDEESVPEATVKEKNTTSDAETEDEGEGEENADEVGDYDEDEDNSDVGNAEPAVEHKARPNNTNEDSDGDERMLTAVEAEAALSRPLLYERNLRGWGSSPPCIPVLPYEDSSDSSGEESQTSIESTLNPELWRTTSEEEDTSSSSEETEDKTTLKKDASQDESEDVCPSIYGSTQSAKTEVDKKTGRTRKERRRKQDRFWINMHLCVKRLEKKVRDKKTKAAVKRGLKALRSKKPIIKDYLDFEPLNRADVDKLFPLKNSHRQTMKKVEVELLPVL